MTEKEELKTYLACDFIYIPYTEKESLRLNENGIIYREDIVSTYNNFSMPSPVSGRPYGLCEMPSVKGIMSTLIIENDFKDKIEKRKVGTNDIYTTKINELDNILKDKIEAKELILEIKNTKNEKYLLKDHITESLETLNLINLKYDIKTKIQIEKNDLTNYKLLFSYLGTYPNIEIIFNKDKITEYKTLNLYETIDIYNTLKNRNTRDYIYLTLTHDKTSNVIKTKKYSNLKDLLVEVGVIGSSIINKKIKIENANFILNEDVISVDII